MVARKSNAEPDADSDDRPLATIGDELDAMVYFDDVLIPVDRRCAHRQSGPRQVVSAAAIRLGASRDPDPPLRPRRADGRSRAAAHAIAGHQHQTRSSQAQLAELIRFRETCRAFMIAAEETGFATPGGLFKPNNIYIDFGRAYYLENQHKMVNMLIDFCGRGVVIQPSRR